MSSQKHEQAKSEGTELVDSKTQTYRSRFKLWRTAGPRGGAGQHGTRREQIVKRTSVPRNPQGIENKKMFSQRLSGSRTSEILCKPNAGTKSPVDNRFVIGIYAVYKRFIIGTRSAQCSWLPIHGSMPFCLCNSFSWEICTGKRDQNHRLTIGL